MSVKCSVAGLAILGSVVVWSSAASACSTSSGQPIGAVSLSCSTRTDFSSWIKSDWFSAAELSIFSTLETWISSPSATVFNAALDSVSTIRESWGGTAPALTQDFRLNGAQVGYEVDAKSGSSFKLTSVPGTGKAEAAVTIRITGIVTSVVDGILTYAVSYDFARSMSESVTGTSGGGTSSGLAQAFPGLFGKGGILAGTRTSGGTSVAESYAFTSNGSGVYRFGTVRVPVPGPVAGAGLPALLVIGIATARRMRRTA